MPCVVKVHASAMSCTAGGFGAPCASSISGRICRRSGSSRVRPGRKSSSAVSRAGSPCSGVPPRAKRNALEAASGVPSTPVMPLVRNTAWRVAGASGVVGSSASVRSRSTACSASGPSSSPRPVISPAASVSSSNTRIVSPTTSVSGSSELLTSVVIGAVVEKPSIRFSATRGSLRSSARAGSSSAPAIGRFSVPSALPAKNRSFGKGRRGAAGFGSNSAAAGGFCARAVARASAAASKS